MRLFLLTLLTMLAFAANSLLNRAAVGAGLIAPLDFAFLRLIAGAAILALLLRARAGLAVRTRGPRRLAGVFGLSAYLLGFSLAYQGLGAGMGALILFGTVQMTMFAGAFLRRERLAPRRILGALIGLAGLTGLLLPAPGALAAPPLAPTLWMLTAGIGWGVYSLAGQGARDALAETGANFFGALMLALPFALFWALLGHTSAPPAPMGLAYAALSGALTSALGYALWYRLLPELGALRAALAQLSVPLWAALGGALWLTEWPDLRFLLAGAVLLSGLALGLPGAPRPAPGPRSR